MLVETRDDSFSRFIVDVGTVSRSFVIKIARKERIDSLFSALRIVIRSSRGRKAIFFISKSNTALQIVIPRYSATKIFLL